MDRDLVIDAVRMDSRAELVCGFAGGLVRIGFVGGSCTEGGGITAEDRWKIWPIR